MESKKCGDYFLHKLLNSGGTADIFLATSPTDSQVIVRRLRSEYQFNIFKRWAFNTGLQIQTQMEHPHIVKVLELVTFTLLPFAALEYIHGINLREVVRNHHSVDPIKLFLQMLDGLSYIHKQGYLHLDFKPENIILDADHHLKILDFDLAEQISKQPLPQSNIKGTPSYLAPEQILKKPVDERTDIFALGVTAYELFTGQKPFKSQDRADIFREITSSGSFISPSSINASLPQGMEQILLRCIEKQPNRRYPTISMILIDLRKAGLID